MSPKPERLDDDDRESAPPPQPKLDARGRRGRTLFFAGLVGYLGWELTVLILQLVNESPLTAQSAVRTFSGLVLFFFAWRGRPWAAVLLTIAFSIFCLAGWSTCLAGDYMEIGWLIAGAGTLFGAWGFALHFAPSLRTYLAFQRTHD